MVVYKIFLQMRLKLQDIIHLSLSLYVCVCMCGVIVAICITDKHKSYLNGFLAHFISNPVIWITYIGLRDTHSNLLPYVNDYDMVLLLA